MENYDNYLQIDENTTVGEIYEGLLYGNDRVIITMNNLIYTTTLYLSENEPSLIIKLERVTECQEL